MQWINQIIHWIKSMFPWNQLIDLFMLPGCFLEFPGIYLAKLHATILEFLHFSQ